ncbi:MAG: CDP-alcohol phosphatidyltransferase family protein [Clostridia bacterium]|nr:CDP-alcohol phosphatidyltransferase family protein [Clostridia bacterium]
MRKYMKFIVNLITTLRFLYALCLPILRMFVSSEVFIINIIILFLSDSIDGTLARKFKVQSLYGSFMDTIADKALIGILLIMLLVDSIDILLVMLIGEVIISIINVVGIFRGKKANASLWGKIKMWLISITLVLCYAYRFDLIDLNILQLSVGMTCGMQILVMIGYVQNLREQDSMKIKEKYEVKNKHDLKFILFDTDYYLNNVFDRK